MNTYTLAQRPRVESRDELQIEEPTPIPNLPLMSIRDARIACDIARKAGQDVIVFNTKAI